MHVLHVTVTPHTAPPPPRLPTPQRDKVATQQVSVDNARAFARRMKGMMQGTQAGVVCIEANLCSTSEVAAIFERCVGEAFQRRRLCTLTACSHGRLNGGDGEGEGDGERGGGWHGTPGSSCSPSKIPPSRTPSKMTKMAKAVAKLKIKVMSKTLRRMSSHQPPVEAAERTSSSNGDSSGGGTIGGGSSDGSPKATTRWWSRFLKSATRLSPMSKPSGRVVPLSGAETQPKTPDFGYENAHQAAAVAALSHKYAENSDTSGSSRKNAGETEAKRGAAAVARREAKRAKREAKKVTAKNKRAADTNKRANTTAATTPTTTTIISATTTATTATANTATISSNNNHDDDGDRLSASVTAALVTHEQQPSVVSAVDDDAEDSTDSDTEEEWSGQRRGDGDGRRGGASSYETKSEAEACELIRSSIPLVRELPPPPLQLAGGAGMPPPVANDHDHGHKLGTGGALTGKERREPASPEDDDDGDDGTDSSATQRGLNEMWPLAFLNDEKQGFLRTLAIAKRKQWGKDAAAEDVWTRWWCCICDRYLLAHESDAGISGQGQQQQQGSSSSPSLPPSPHHIIMLFDLWSPHTEYRPGSGDTAFCIREVKVPNNNNNDTRTNSDNSSGRRSSDSSDCSKRSNRAAHKEVVTHRFQSATKEDDKSWALAVQTRMLARDDPVERRRSKQLHANMTRFLQGSSSGGLGDFLQHRPRQRISEAVGTWPEKRASYALLDDGSRFLRTVAFRNSVFSDFDIDIQAFHRWEEKLGAEAKKRAMRRRENGGKDPDEDYGEEGGGSKTRTSKRGQKK